MGFSSKPDMTSTNSITTIIFDLGGVLIDWNPRHLYKKIFKTEAEITWFLENVCTPEWNEQQDAGRSEGGAKRTAVEGRRDWRCRQGAVGIHGDGGDCPVHRLCERRKPAAGQG